MSAYAEAMRRHADELVDEQLHRVRHRLDALEPERRRAVEANVRAVVDRVADAIITEAPRSPMLAAALESIYGQTTPAAVPVDARRH
ncbi:MAG: hypothetical protein QOF45_496 [Gaiellaceae bacterium]|nr:hypothetical protein [Gaiellaceae bacterium]